MRLNWLVPVLVGIFGCDDPGDRGSDGGKPGDQGIDGADGSVTPDLAVSPRTLRFAVGDVKFQWSGPFPEIEVILGGTATGDFNADHKEDLVLAYQKNRGFQLDAGAPDKSLLCLSAGGVSRATPVDCTVMGRPLHAGHFNRDGKLDLYFETCGVFLGTGDGGFRPAAAMPGFTEPSGVMATGDFDEDGLDDVVISVSAAAVRLSAGDGSFHAAAAPFPVADLFGAVAARIDGDQHLDLLAYPNTDKRPIQVLLGAGDGSFRVAPPLPAGIAPRLVGDFDGDGKLDLWGDGKLAVGNGDGTFAAPRPAATNGIYVQATADFDGDGHLDFVGDASPNLMQNVHFAVALGRGDGTFNGPLPFEAASSTGGQLDDGFFFGGVFDLDGNGQPDIWGNTSLFEGMELITRVNTTK